MSAPDDAEARGGATPTAEAARASERDERLGGAGASMIAGAVIIGALSALVFSGTERLFAFLIGAPMGVAAGYRFWLRSRDD